MRHVIIITSLISFILFAVGLTIRLLTNPANIIWPTLPWFFSTSLIIAGFIIMAVALICYGIYFSQQVLAKERVFKRWRISTRNSNLLRNKAEKVKSYKREVWLQLTLFIILGLVMMSTPAIALIQMQSVPYPTGSFDLLFWPIAPVSIFICTFLSKDLASQNRKKP